MFQKWLKPFFALAGFILLFILIKVFTFSSESKLSDEAYHSYFNSNYKIFCLNIPKNLNFSEEMVPVNDLSVRESMDRELLVNTYWQSQTLLVHKRANRWFPLIEKVLKKHNIPDDFKYIAAAESGLTNVISPMKATGYWQFIETTALKYGLEINDEVDERFHIEKSTEAACMYFKEAYQKFNNWTLAAASYNMGIGGVEGQLEKQQVNNYYDLLLNEETSRYVFRLLALKEVISKPKAYGFVMRTKDLYPPVPVKKIKVDSAVTDLVAFAAKQGVTYRVLKIFNPWLRKSSLSNPGEKTYYIDIPSKGFINNNFEEENAFETVTSTPADSSQYFHTTSITDSINPNDQHQ